MKYLFLLLLIAFTCEAAVKLTGTPIRVMDESDRKTVIYDKAEVSLPKGKEAQDLYLTGAGLREKPVLFFTPNVYIAAHYWNLKGDKIDPSAPMSSIKKSSLRLIHLSMLRTLSAEKIMGSFRDALTLNGVDVEVPVWQKLFDGFTAEATEGAQIDIIGRQVNEGEQEVRIEIPSAKFSTSIVGPSVADQMWLIWFGKTGDSGLEALKKALIGATPASS